VDNNEIGENQTSTIMTSKAKKEGPWLPLLPEPRGFTGFQIADHADEFHLLTEGDLIHPISLSGALRRVGF
jgi:hypothetical protein